MGEFKISIKPDVLMERANKAEAQTLDALTQRFQLPKGEVLGDGVDLQEAPHLDLDTFMKLSDNDTKITKADLIRFARQEAPEGIYDANDVVKDYAQRIANSVPAKVLDSSSTPDGAPAAGSLEFEVRKRGLEIFVSAKRHAASPNAAQPKTEATASAVFSILNSKDLNEDGQISIGGKELRPSAFVATVADALRLADGGTTISPTQAMKAILTKAGQVNLPDLDIQYNQK